MQTLSRSPLFYVAGTIDIGLAWISIRYFIQKYIQNISIKILYYYSVFPFVRIPYIAEFLYNDIIAVFSDTYLNLYGLMMKHDKCRKNECRM